MISLQSHSQSDISTSPLFFLFINPTHRMRSRPAGDWDYGLTQLRDFSVPPIRSAANSQSRSDYLWLDGDFCDKESKNDRDFACLIVSNSPGLRVLNWLSP